MMRNQFPLALSKTSAMKIVDLDKDINVMYVTASSFPEGIMEAFNRLHQLIPGTTKHTLYGISRPENGGQIVYRAATGISSPVEAEKYHLESLTLKKGRYICQKVDHIQNDPQIITETFQNLLQHPDLDPQGYCVEQYEPDEDSVLCMIRLS
jgi:predicted transcriptional regulator YdeE